MQLLPPVLLRHTYIPTCYLLSKVFLSNCVVFSVLCSEKQCAAVTTTYCKLKFLHHTTTHYLPTTYLPHTTTTMKRCTTPSANQPLQVLVRPLCMQLVVPPVLLRARERMLSAKKGKWKYSSLGGQIGGQRLNLSGSQHKGCSQRLQYLDL